MAEEIAFKNSRISNFKGLVTLTLTLDGGHTAHRRASLIDSSKKVFVDGRTFETHFIRSTLSKSRLKTVKQICTAVMHNQLQQQDYYHSQRDEDIVICTVKLIHLTT